MVTDDQRFPAIHNSSPVASWDSKVSIECTLKGGVCKIDEDLLSEMHYNICT